MLVEAAVPHIETLLNRKLRDSVTAREFCKTLSGKVLEINITEVPERILLAPLGESIEILTDADMKAQVVFSGSVFTFMQATQQKPLELVRAGKLTMKGDAVLAGQFQRLIELAMPDWQEELAKLFGDYVGPQLSNVLQGLASIGQELFKSFEQTTKPETQAESPPAQEEFEQFSEDLDTLQKDLDELDKSC
ncbi:MAG: hypothetical protein HKN88_09310 [Gammaproteobacteria bacterium]|nr:SCP2 sterol-binding domain-containing protein [Gammaproteobacteria bacterium]NNC98253.1 hypothetical protein [Gammaproteobacteria bacterium]NNM14900.1 hypothetical protein [Gammaproteobacteria bacterium]